MWGLDESSCRSETMKRIAWLVIAVLGLGTSLFAADKSMDMTGMLCNSKCVTQSTGHAACDSNCQEKSGDIVLVEDDGKVIKIANQEKVMPMNGKKVKMKCHKDKKNPDSMYVDSLALYEG
jgi:hypothetical protein